MSSLLSGQTGRWTEWFLCVKTSRSVNVSVIYLSVDLFHSKADQFSQLCFVLCYYQDTELFEYLSLQDLSEFSENADMIRTIRDDEFYEVR